MKFKFSDFRKRTTPPKVHRWIGLWLSVVRAGRHLTKAASEWFLKPFGNYTNVQMGIGEEKNQNILCWFFSAIKWQRGAKAQQSGKRAQYGLHAQWSRELTQKDSVFVSVSLWAWKLSLKCVYDEVSCVPTAAQPALQSLSQIMNQESMVWCSISV